MPDALEAAPAVVPPWPSTAPSERLAALIERAEVLIPSALAGDEEAVHDLRVALRRLRVLGRHPASAEDHPPLAVAELRAGATGLFRALGGVRDLDILARELEALVAAGQLPAPLDPALSGWLDLERRRLRAGLPAAAAFFRDEVARFQSAAGSRGVPGGSAAGPGGVPGVVSAAFGGRARRKAALRRPARKLLRALDVARRDPTVERLHRLRIRGKKLRYAAEPFSPPASPGSAPEGGPEGGAGTGTGHGPLESGLKKLQDALGAVQDAAMVVSRLDALAAAGVLAPVAAGPGRVAAANERDRRRSEFLADLGSGGYANLFGGVKNVARKQGDGTGDAPREADSVPLEHIPGIGAAKARRLAEAGLASPEALRAASLEDLAAVKTIGPHQARLIKEYMEGGGNGREEGAGEGDLDGKRFERVQSVLALGAAVADYALTLGEDLLRQEERDAVRAGRQAERLTDRLSDLSERVAAVPTKRLKGLRGELRETEGLLAKVLALDVSSLKLNKLRKALKAHRKALDGYLA